jgi:hypothetical protein
MNNTAFGGNIPSLPQWAGPPHAMIQVQAMLYASLAASLLSAFLAMLGKQWLNRYALTNMRGSGIERSQDRQRKLNGIVTWYFEQVMESLPLMLQFALLLLGCALSLYLWGINVTVAWVVVGVTGLGVTLYAFFVIAGAASASCPYQTPAARILRRTLPLILPLLRSAPRALVNNSECLVLFSGGQWRIRRGWKGKITFLFSYIVCFPLLLATDVWHLTKAIIKVSIALTYRVHSWIRRARSTQANQQTAVLDSRCISWILQTSLEKGIRLSTLKFLTTTPTLVDFTPALVSDCFDILIDCVKVNKRNPAIVQGMEQLAEASAMCFFLTYSRLSIIDPMSSFLLDIRQHYRRIFPLDLDFSSLPFPHTLGTIHEATCSDRESWTSIEPPIEWRDYEPTDYEHTTVAHALSKLSWSEYQRRGPNNVPPSCLSFALHYLSQDPLPPPSIVIDCLIIIAVYLGCNVPHTMVLRERYVHPWGISATLLTDSQCTT